MAFNGILLGFTPLGTGYTTMETHHLLIGKLTNFLWPCSVVMLIYQRVVGFHWEVGFILVFEIRLFTVFHGWIRDNKPPMMIKNCETKQKSQVNLGD